MDRSPTDFRPGGAPLRIGVVDDDPAFRRALERLLRGAGFDVDTFSSAEEYLRARPRHDCLVLDVFLGGMSGPDLREELGRKGELVPVVFITAHQDLAELTHAVGGAPCLSKPFDEKLLFDAIARVTGGSAPP